MLHSTYISLSLYFNLVLCVGKEYMPNPSPETDGTTFVCVYTGKYWKVLSTSSRPTLHMRSVVLATCETETALGEYVKHNIVLCLSLVRVMRTSFHQIYYPKYNQIHVQYTEYGVRRYILKCILVSTCTTRK